MTSQYVKHGAVFPLCFASLWRRSHTAAAAAARDDPITFFLLILIADHLSHISQYIAFVIVTGELCILVEFLVF